MGLRWTFSWTWTLLKGTRLSFVQTTAAWRPNGHITCDFPSAAGVTGSRFPRFVEPSGRSRRRVLLHVDCLVALTCRTIWPCTWIPRKSKQLALCKRSLSEAPLPRLVKMSPAALCIKGYRSSDCGGEVEWQVDFVLSYCVAGVGSGSSR